MTEAGFFERKPINRTGLAIVITMHAAAITALALSKTEVIRRWEPPLVARIIKQPDDPPPVDQKPVERTSQPVRPVTRPDVPIKIVNDNNVHSEVVDWPRQPVIGEPVIKDQPPTSIDPPKAPVQIAARLDARSELQPAYPPSEQRMGNEGAVIVRVLIGADGRVKKVEKVSAGSEAFFRATERQALRYWRFKPATLDGQPIESWQQMTVRFQLSA